MSEPVVKGGKSESSVNGREKQGLNFYSEIEITDAEEIQISLPFGHVAGKWWGPKNQQPVICLHGWLDNAGTFDTLAPLLSENVALLAVDLVGHGKSSHQPAGVCYFLFWEGVILLRKIVNHYNWNKIKILGHSLGGAIGFMYASTFPDEVESLICLDVASPNTRKFDSVLEIAGVYIEKLLTYETPALDNDPCYTYEEMVDLAEYVYRGSITRESAKVMMRRGTIPAPKPGRFKFSLDPRVKIAGLAFMSNEIVEGHAEKIQCSYLNIRAVPGMKFEETESYQKVLNIIKKRVKKFEYHEVPGTHHVHLNNPERVAPIIKAFLES